MKFLRSLAVAASSILPFVAAQCSSNYTGSADLEPIFDAFQTQLFSGDVAGAFATYVSPDLIEHTAASSSYASDVQFLSILFPTVSITTIPGLQHCVADICFIHYYATPIGNASFIANVTAISDFYRFNGTCIVEHWDSTQTAGTTTTNPLFPN